MCDKAFGLKLDGMEERLWRLLPVRRYTAKHTIFIFRETESDRPRSTRVSIIVRGIYCRDVCFNFALFG